MIRVRHTVTNAVGRVPESALTKWKTRGYVEDPGAQPLPEVTLREEVRKAYQDAVAARNAAVTAKEQAAAFGGTNAQQVAGMLEDPGVVRAALDLAAAELLDDPDSAFRARQTASFGAPAIRNPETEQNAAVVEVVEGVLGGGVDSLMQTIDARGVPSASRPASGRVLWLINDGESDPVHVQSGDVVMQVGVVELSWTPALGVPGMVGWFDAQALGLSDGAAVPSWPNLAPSGNPLLQPTAGAQPVVDVDKINGHPAVIADGTNDYLTFDCPDYTGPITLYVVAGTDLADNAAGSDFLIGAANAGTSTLRMDLYRTAAEAYNLARGSILTSPDAAWTTGHKLIKAVGNGGSSSISVNGSSVATGNVGTNPEVTRYNVFSRSDAANFFPGYLGELIIVHGTVDAPTDEKIRTYLAARWSL